MSDNRLAQAQQALQAGNLEMAESLYSTLLQDLPTADVYYGLGLIAHKKNLHQEALIWIEQAILLSPDNALFWFGKAVVLFEDGVYAEAIDSFEKVLALNPDSFPVYFILAGAYAKEGLLDKAERAYQVLLSQEPTHMDALNNLGNIYLQKKYLKKAIRCFKKALDIQNTYAKVHNNLGTLYLNYGKPQKALSYFRDAIRYQPDQAYFYNNLANALKQLGLSDEAIENYEYAIQLNPAYVSAYRNLALLYRENFQYEQALTLLHKALSFKVDVQVLIELGDVSLSMGQVEQAIEYYDKAYSLEPKVSIQFKLARILPCIYRSIEDVYFWRQRFERSYESLKQQNLKLSDPIGEIGAANFYLAYQGLNNCSTYKTVGEVFLNALELMQSLGLVSSRRTLKKAIQS
jgi:protein O-GlcNAc transferase